MATTRKRRTPASRSRKITVGGLVKDLQAPALITAGMVGGKYIATGIDSLVSKMLPEPVVADPAVSGLAGTVKSYITPVGLLAIGLIAPKFTSNAMIKNALAGVAVYGALKTVKEVTSADLLAGFKGVRGLKGSPMGRLGNPYRMTARIPANAMTRPTNTGASY